MENNRSERLTVLMTTDERQNIRDRASNAGVSDSRYVRWHLFGDKRDAVIEDPEVACALRTGYPSWMQEREPAEEPDEDRAYEERRDQLAGFNGND